MYIHVRVYSMNQVSNFYVHFRFLFFFLRFTFQGRSWNCSRHAIYYAIINNFLFIFFFSFQTFSRHNFLRQFFISPLDQNDEFGSTERFIKGSRND